MRPKLSFQDKHRKQSGLFIVFTSILLMAILLLIGLMIDIGRFVVTARNIQIAAEAAALAGVERLKKCDINVNHSTPLNFDCLPYAVTDNGNGGWQASKAAIITALTDIKVLGRELGTPVFSSIPTRCDIDDTIDGFGNLGYEEGAVDDLTFRAERMFECIDSLSGNLTLISLEESSYNRPAATYHYCLANAVRITLNYTGHVHMLSHLFGMSSATSISKSSVARIRPTDISRSCNFPSCDLMDDPTTLCSPTC